MFLFSQLDSEINRAAGSRNRYNIITGLNSIDNIEILKPRANKIRNSLLANGVKNIVCVFDKIHRTMKDGIQGINCKEKTIAI